MTFRVDISQEASIDLDRAVCHYGGVNLENSFLADFDRQIIILSKLPFAFQIRYGDSRILKLDSFNFTIHYAIKDDFVLIYRILGQGQNY